MPEKMAPIHAGEILQELFLGPAGISAYRLAKESGLSPTRISQILLDFDETGHGRPFEP